MWREIWEKHSGKVIGAACGLFFGFIYLIWGFWDMLIFAFIMFIGYYVGSKLDRQEAMPGLEEIWQRLMEKWRMFR